MHKLSMLKMISVGLVIGLLSGCGGSSKGAPHGGSITINPASLTWTVPASVCSGNFHYTEFMITVTDKAGRPASKVDIDVTLDFSLGTSAFDRFRLYDDPAWAGSGTTPTNRVTPPYSTSTGDFGTKRLIVGVDLSCPITKGYLSVYSGEIFAQAAIEIAN